jgi:2-keto-4-pentenoate hydratase/2-oxohepta-3-ene-1,7-dioic acid hydratase in catechol pathway
MRLVSFGPPGAERPGVLTGDSVIDLADLAPELGGSLREVLAGDRVARLAQLLVEGDTVPAGAAIRISEVRLGPPIPDPGKIICVGLNYVDHAAEQDKPLPERPLLFSKAASALTGPYDEVVIPDGLTHIDYEAELAFVIGRPGRDIPEERAMQHVAGYTVLNDVTARRLQKQDGQWFRGKSVDTFGPCGPALVTADEIPDPHALEITLELNGERRQRSTTANLHFRIGFLVAYVSRTMTLHPGDIVSTGTPGGVGVYSESRVFLKHGDRMVTRVEGLGELRNRVRQI